MFIFVTWDVSPFAGFAWFLARAVLNIYLFISDLGKTPYDSLQHK